MTCEHIRKNLFAYLDHELPEPVLGEIQSHLETCSACQAILDQHRKLASVLLETPAPQTPEDLSQRILAQAIQHPTQQITDLPISRKWHTGIFAQRVAAAAVLVIGLSLGTLMGRSTWKKPTPPPNEQLVSLTDPIETYNFDYLTSAPQGSMEQAFLTLTSLSDEIEVKK